MADTCCIRVVCRVRPLNSKEIASGSEFVTTFPAEKAVALKSRVFQFDHVFKPEFTQSQVYALSALPLVKDVLSGYNATIFAYGQTASGKTHTMEGDLIDPDLQGITPRIINEIFEQIYAMDTNLEFHIKVSYFELYMEKIRDLLDVTKVNLPIHETKKKVPYVKGITERFVTAPDEVQAIIEEGKSNRHVSVTNMNTHSSRSHAIFLISIKQENKETHHTLTGKLYLVDLAGSEKVEKTNAQGLTLEEAKTINKSLLALSNVISALSEGTKSHIPYRDSKLTRVLQESLGGNARTTLVICCSPSSYNESETKSTLSFGDRAKMIKNKVEINVELTAEEWRKRYEKQKEECENLKRLLNLYTNELNLWRKGESVPAGEQVSIKNIRQSSGANRISTKDIPITSAVPTSSAPPPSVLRELEEERGKLCQQLDEKDEDIHKQTQLVEQLTLQIKDLQEIIEKTQEESSLLKHKIIEVEQELSRSQEEVQEVMQALEELAVSYEDKDSEILSLQYERESLAIEIEKLQSSVQSRDGDIKSLNDKLTSERKRNKHSIVNIFRELSEMGNILGSKSDDRLQAVESHHELTEEDFTRARIHLSNMRIEARTLTEQRNILEQAEKDAKNEAESALKELNTLRLKLSQLETQTDTLQISLKDVECQKQDLENALEELNDQLVSLRSKESEVTAAAEHDRKQVQLQRALEEEIIEHRETHHRQMSALRAEIANKEYLISELQEQYQRQQLAKDTIQTELLNIQLQKQEYTLLSERLTLKDKAEQEYNGITDTVKRELGQLDTLKQALYKKLGDKMMAKQQSLSKESPERGEVKFIEKNLDELSRMHKKTLSAFSDLQREIPKYQSILDAKTKRIKELESVLKETREAADREYRKLQDEKEQMKTAFMEKLKDRERGYMYRRQGPTIVRPVVRPKGVESGCVISPGGNTRDALLAVAGVQMINQSKRSPLLANESVTQDSSGSQNQSQTQTETISPQTYTSS